MKRVLIVFLLTVFSVMAFSFEVPPLTGRVVDNAGIFTSDEIRLLDSKIQKFESSTGGQLVVAVLKQLDGTAIEEAGIQMADKWKIGNKDKDNGIILILSMQERAMRVEVGYGWEGCVTDARAGDVIRFMKPYFQKAQYFSGISGGIEKLQTYVTGISPDGETQMSSGEFDSFAEDYAGGVIPPQKKRQIERVSEELFDSCEIALYFLAAPGSDPHTAMRIDNLLKQENFVVVFLDTSLTGEDDLHNSVKILYGKDTYQIYDEEKITQVIEKQGYPHWRNKDYFRAAYCTYLAVAYDYGKLENVVFSESAEGILDECFPQYDSILVWGIAILFFVLMILGRLGIYPFGFLVGSFFGGTRFGSGGFSSDGGFSSSGGGSDGGGGHFGGGGASGKW